MKEIQEFTFKELGEHAYHIAFHDGKLLSRELVIERALGFGEQAIEN